jgi:hypothetical protein
MLIILDVMHLKHQPGFQLLLLTGVFTFSISIAQDKLLTIQDAVLKGRTSLAPKRLQALGFIKDSNKFSYIDNNVIKVGDNAIGKTIDVLTLKELNAILKLSSKDTLASFTTITWKSANQFYFSNKKGELLYSLDKKIFLKQTKKQSQLL